jgi:hypothetical protein
MIFYHLKSQNYPLSDSFADVINTVKKVDGIEDRLYKLSGLWLDYPKKRSDADRRELPYKSDLLNEMGGKGNVVTEDTHEKSRYDNKIGKYDRKVK